MTTSFGKYKPKNKQNASFSDDDLGIGEENEESWNIIICSFKKNLNQ